MLGSVCDLACNFLQDHIIPILMSHIITWVNIDRDNLCPYYCDPVGLKHIRLDWHPVAYAVGLTWYLGISKEQLAFLRHYN